MTQEEALEVKDLAKPVVEAWIEVFRGLGEIKQLINDLEENNEGKA